MINANQDISRQEELDNCHFIKIVLMLIVVFYHSVLCWNGEWFKAVPMESNLFVTRLTGWMATFHIQAFTLVSGYIFHFTQYERGRKQKYKNLMLSKAKRLLVPYVCVSLLWLVPHDIWFNGLSISEFFLDYVFAESPLQLWFLWMLMVVFSIFAPIADFIRKHEVYGLMLISILWFVGFLGLAKLPNIFQLWKGCKYLLYFWIGFKFRQHGTQRLQKIPALVWLGMHIALYWGSQHMPNQTLISKLLFIGLRELSPVMGAIMAFMVLSRLAKSIQWRKIALFRILKHVSMPIYLFHEQIIYWLIWLLRGRLPVWAHALVNFTGAVTISLALSCLLMRFRKLRWMLGEK